MSTCSTKTDRFSESRNMSTAVDGCHGVTVSGFTGGCVCTQKDGGSHELNSRGTLVNGHRLLQHLFPLRNDTKPLLAWQIPAYHVYSHTHIHPPTLLEYKLFHAKWGHLVQSCTATPHQSASCWQTISFSVASVKPEECHSAHITLTKMNGPLAAASRGLQLKGLGNLLHQI